MTRATERESVAWNLHKNLSTFHIIKHNDKQAIISLFMNKSLFDILKILRHLNLLSSFILAICHLRSIYYYLTSIPVMLFVICGNNKSHSNVMSESMNTAYGSWLELSYKIE